MDITYTLFTLIFTLTFSLLQVPPGLNPDETQLNVDITRDGESNEEAQTEQCAVTNRKCDMPEHYHSSPQNYFTLLHSS